MASPENVSVELEESKAPWRRLFQRNRPTVPPARQISPEFEAGFSSKLTFSWMGPLMATGYRRPLKLDDIPLLNSSRSVHGHSIAFNAHFAAAVASDDTKDPLFTSLHKTFFREFWIGGIYRLVTDILTVASPYTLRYLIQFAEDSYYGARVPEDGASPPLGRGIGLLVGIVLMQMLLSLGQNHFSYCGQMIGGQVRAVLTAKLLEKSMKISERARAGGFTSPGGESIETVAVQEAVETKYLSPHDGQDTGSLATKENASTDGWNSSSSRLVRNPRANEQTTEPENDQGWSNGRVINLLSMDTHRIDECLGMVHVVWTSPIMILICMALLIVNLSYSALAGLGCLIFAMFFLVTGVKAIYDRRQGMNMTTDARVSLTQEVLQAIRLVKYFSWEESFIERLVGIRAEETRKLRGYMAIFNAITCLGQSLPMLAAMVSFVTFALGSGRELNAAVVFSSIALFSALLIPTAYLPGCLGQASDAWASLKRIEEYLLAEEVEDFEMDRDMEFAVEIKDAAFTRERSYPASGKPSSISVKSSEHVSTTSRDGSTTPFSIPSFSLSVRHGELLGIMGSIGSGKTSLMSAMTGDMRKVHGSLRFASKLAFCPQTAWIQNTTVRNNITFGAPFDPAWYETIISACQLRRDLEILPNGDTTEIGERGINLSGGQKQRISLARAIYSRSDILLLDDPLSAVDPYVGEAIFNEAILSVLDGKTRILATHQAHILRRCDRILWLEEGRIKALGTYDTLIDQYPKILGDLVYEADGTQDKAPSKEEDEKTHHVTRSEEETATLEKKLAGNDKLPALIQAEDQTSAGISWAVYTSYITSSHSNLLIILAFPLLILAQGSSLLCGLWLAWWTLDRFGLTRNTYIAIYVALAIIQGLLLYLFSLSISICCTRSSKFMLNKAVRRVIHAPVWVFDATPLGRMTTRFSKDIEVMDDTLPEALRLFMVATAMILGILGLIVAYFHWFAIALAPSVIVFFFYSAYYRASAREIKRHEAVLRGVVVARFSETLAGVTTIRTYSMQPHFSDSLNLAIDNNNSANYLTISSQRWLALRLDTIGVILIITSGVLVVVDRFSQFPAISGLILSYALGALQVLQFVVRQWVRVENAMNATERLYEYGTGEILPIEGDNGKPMISTRTSWPEQGAITFSNVHMRYRPGLPEVLCGFDLTVNAGEHVAIVGRTGAGKSSFVSSLFRVCELSGGCISIDGVDISRVLLKDLRSRLSIQPQDSILFRGTVRSNLDPFHQHTDEELWLALRGAWLANSVYLDDVVQDEGSNFSHGQRQQLGLARLLVRGNKIVVCDEATSSVDLETDEKIQRTMVEAFKGKTVLTVAHRIRTIVHYDRVCVMDQGKIVELGTPMELWKSGGLFRGMCEASGISHADLERVQ
ncbi:plasma membrane ATP-binding cassette transporter [Coleophoma crateriformis]|uniref:Plasma membrane ATP-binding cassette transporter n=1 Tax=Coleophoma crateriformis TaxID=565419 RepID=A0A3D8QCC7_9HELO|nr:plasma membrane ATP-binding cassette transporter [Coleophoma crateriformis]